MFKTFAGLALAGAVSANEPSLIESKMEHFSNDKYDIVITQLSGQENFTMIERGTYGDPDPVCKNCTEKFFVDGVWNTDVAIAKVNFKCILMGAEAYSQDYACPSNEANDYGNCPASAGKDSEWNADFGFDVPPIAPPFEYDVYITAYDANGGELWQLGSKFFIP